MNFLDSISSCKALYQGLITTVQCKIKPLDHFFLKQNWYLGEGLSTIFTYAFELKKPSIQRISTF